MKTHALAWMLLVFCGSFAWSGGSDSSEVPLKIRITKVVPNSSMSIDFCISNTGTVPVYVHDHIAYRSSVINRVGSIRIRNLETDTWKILPVSLKMDGDDSYSASERDFIPFDPGYSLCSSQQSPQQEPLTPGRYEIVISFHSDWFAKEKDQKKWRIKPWRGEILSEPFGFEVVD